VTFDSVCRWLDDRLSRQVQVTISGPPESRGNSGVVFSGALAPGSGEVSLVDPRGGALRQWAVGQAGDLWILEGDFVEAELEPDDVDALVIETRELSIIVTVTDWLQKRRATAFA
jgi:hypothetical protein